MSSLIEQCHMSFGFSGSGTSCNVSPFWGVNHHWYTWNPLIHERKLNERLLAISCSGFISGSGQKTLEKPIAFDCKLPELETFFVVSTLHLMSFMMP